VRYFSKPDGTRIGAGDLLKNPAYAATVHRLAIEGASALYHGTIAADIVERVHQEPIPGSLSLEDLAGYRPIESEALCRPWHGLRVCTPPPPAAGVDLLQGLLLLAHTDIDQRNASDPVAWVQLGEAERLLYADRNRYVADPAFVSVPLAGLLDAAYLQGRASLIGETIASTPPQAGVPPGAPLVGRDHTAEPGGTTHFVVVDSAGNVVSMTTTVESIFGSGRMVDGFFLNNQLTDFSFSPTEADGRAAANAVAPGKRPRSAMAPTIVARCGWPLRRSRWFGGRTRDHFLRAQDAGCDARLAHVDGSGDSTAQSRRARRQFLRRGRQVPAGIRRRAQCARPQRASRPI
jgi:gamma-glutamyltranspeptidase / glutathione hydrolase